MAKSGRAGIGSFVMRGHEYLVAILADNGILRAEVLRYADELRSPEDIGLPKPGKPDAKLQRELAREIDALSKPGLDLSELADVDAEALHKLAQQKAKSGKGVVAMEDLEDEDGESGGSAEVIDLMQALRNSLGAKSTGAAPAAAGRKGAHKAAPHTAAKKAPAAKRAPAKTAAPKSATTAKTAARKSAAKRSAAKKAA